MITSLFALQAQRHILVLARANGLDSIANVHSKHLSLLTLMHSVGLKWTEKFLDENGSLSFRLGYHSVCCNCFVL